VAKHEVTVGQFRDFATETNYQADSEHRGGFGWDASVRQFGPKRGINWKSPGFTQEEMHPVVLVSFNDALAFCQWLSNKTGAKYRLLTEEQWEYTARAVTVTLYSSGNAEIALPAAANLADKSAQLPWSKDWQDLFSRTAPVGSFQPNAFGVHDMHGNVYEWCSNVYAPYNQPPPLDGLRRVTRGGAWESLPEMARSALRLPRNAGWCCDATGFRVVLIPPHRTLHRNGTP
jgi:formylglycine-generating enzyme required for sulfatase activity